MKASFEGCSKYIVVDFPPCSSKHESYNLARARRNEMMRARSLKCLQNALDDYKCPLATPSLRSTIRKGRLILLGTCASAKNMIAKLLVNGTFDRNSISGKKEGQQGEASCSSSMHESTKGITPCLNVPTREATSYEELEGRGWQVVNSSRRFGLDGIQVTDLYGFPYEIEQAMLHGSYSHIIYIEQCGDTSAQEKIMLEKLTEMLMVVEDHLVAVIVETKGGDYNKKWSDTQSQREKDVTKRFKRWNSLCLHFPNVSNDPNVEVENIIVRNKSLCKLEETLGEIVVPYVLFQYPMIHLLESYGDVSLDLLYDEQIKRAVYLTKVPSPLNALSKFYARRFGKSHGRICCDRDIQPLHLASDYPCSYEVSHILPIWRWQEKINAVELKLEISSPQKIYVVVNCTIKLGVLVAQNWIWGELQVVDMHHVDKNCPKLALTSNQWKKELEHTNEDRRNRYLRFSINVIRSNEDMTNHIFLDNIEKGDTLILWLCPYSLEDDFCFLSTCMRVEPTQKIINLSINL
jgi:hypothetical protein